VPFKGSRFSKQKSKRRCSLSPSSLNGYSSKIPRLEIEPPCAPSALLVSDSAASIALKGNVSHLGLFTNLIQWESMIKY
jgi:hypothetical protein